MSTRNSFIIISTRGGDYILHLSEMCGRRPHPILNTCVSHADHIQSLIPVCGRRPHPILNTVCHNVCFVCPCLRIGQDLCDIYPTTIYKSPGGDLCPEGHSF